MPCFQAGKIDNLLAWLGKNGKSLDDSTFYFDSHNDLPMLKLVEHPAAVNADPILRKYARGTTGRFWIGYRNPAEYYLLSQNPLINGQ